MSAVDEAAIEELRMSTAPIRILIADGHPIVLEGLKKIFTDHPIINVIGESTDGMDTIEKTVQLEPDVVLMELRLPRVDGLTVLRSIQTRAPKSRVILFSAPENREEFVEAMKLGCSGVVHKDVPVSLLEKSIVKVHEGEIWLDSNTTAAVMRKFASPGESAPAPMTNGKAPRERAQLSQREREIIILIAQGYKNKEIAEKMFITEQTVKNHLHNVFDKLGVSDRLELALYAIHNSLHLRP
jgi:DNA-binding NarL/FixJ family response regulator